MRSVKFPTHSLRLLTFLGGSVAFSHAASVPSPAET
ncbi:MAG: hypothetical protein RLZZ221_2378, partial [Verrucomicrobiota bacterium]